MTTNQKSYSTADDRGRHLGLWWWALRCVGWIVSQSCQITGQDLSDAFKKSPFTRWLPHKCKPTYCYPIGVLVQCYRPQWAYWSGQLKTRSFQPRDVTHIIWSFMQMTWIRRKNCTPSSWSCRGCSDVNALPLPIPLGTLYHSSWFTGWHHKGSCLRSGWNYLLIAFLPVALFATLLAKHFTAFFVTRTCVVSRTLMVQIGFRNLELSRTFVTAEAMLITDTLGN
jgi:hypothetical protein